MPDAVSPPVAKIVTSNEPPGPYGIVRPPAYGGGFDDTHAELELSPVVSMPPMQGVGSWPGPLSTHTET